jgi:PLP dependent protein
MVDTTLIEKIKSNLESVESNIFEAASKSDRTYTDIRIVVVSKRQPIETILAAAAAGMANFGENYPEEAETKIDAIHEKFPEIKWHMIGHLQSRKVKIVGDKFDWMHSIDSIHIAEKLNSILEEKKKQLPVFLEINVSGEESKSGWPAWDENEWPRLENEILPLLSLRRLQIEGLMTMPPLFDEAEKTRPYFQKLRKFREFLRKRSGLKLPELSMGTSIDYQVAIEEGATFVRIGQAILGPRLYNRGVTLS